MQTAGGIGQIATGVGLILAPEPTTLTKVAGVAITGWGAVNVKTGFDTIVNSFQDKGPSKNPIQTGLEKVGATVGKTIGGKEGEKIGSLTGKTTFLAIDTAINVKGTIDSVKTLNDISKASKVGYDIVNVGKTGLTTTGLTLSEVKAFQSLVPSATKSAMTGMGLAVDVKSYPGVVKDAVQITKDLTQSNQKGSECKGN